MSADPPVGQQASYDEAAAAFGVAMPLGIAVGRRRARRFQARIDELDALGRGDQPAVRGRAND